MKKHFLFFFSTLFFLSANAQDAYGILQKTLQNITQGKCYEYNFHSRERDEKGKFGYAISLMRVNTKPHYTYMKFSKTSTPAKEILFNKDLYGGKVLVSIGSFVPTLKLNPMGERLRAGQHHTVLETGFVSTYNLIKNLLGRASKKTSEYLKLVGDVSYRGRNCWKIEVTDKDFDYKEYTLKEGESYFHIAQKNDICEYLILEKNENVKSYFDYQVGKTILVPTTYLKKAILYIDKENFHPIYQEMFDDKGVFEIYEFEGLKINPSFDEKTFSKDNPEYKL